MIALLHSTYCPFKSLTILESESGGLFVRDATRRLKTVEQNWESVLLFKNLNNYRQKNAIKEGIDFATYLDKEVRVQVGTPRVNFVWVLNSSSFHEINSLLNHTTIRYRYRITNQVIILCCLLISKRLIMSLFEGHLPFPCEYIYINNKVNMF